VIFIGSGIAIVVRTVAAVTSSESWVARGARQSVTGRVGRHQIGAVRRIRNRPHWRNAGIDRAGGGPKAVTVSIGKEGCTGRVTADAGSWIVITIVVHTGGVAIGIGAIAVAFIVVVIAVVDDAEAISIGIDTVVGRHPAAGAAVFASVHIGVRAHIRVCIVAVNGGIGAV
jgi:hypothetical protein